MASLVPNDAVRRLRNEGYLTLSLDQVTGTAVMRVLESAREFFQAPLADKHASSLPHDCGYRPMGMEYSQTPERPDRMESFSVSVLSIGSASQLSFNQAIRLHSEMVNVFNRFESIVAELGWMIGREYGCSNTADLRSGFRDWSQLQLNHSRPAMEGSHLINDLHEDGGFLTLACATGPGLEIKLRDGTLLPLTAQPPIVLIMPGEIAWLLTGGAIPPLYHHVRAAAEVKERMSLLLFADLDPRMCQPWVKNELNANVDVGGRAMKNLERFGLQPLPYK